MEATSALMNHEGVATILATGGNAMVKAAYSCGKPALGVGAGNVLPYSLTLTAIGFCFLMFSPGFARAAVGMVLVGMGDRKSVV